jgi:hypothetical protein
MKVTGTGNVSPDAGRLRPGDSVIALEILMDAPALRGAVIDTAVAIIGEQGRAAAEQKLAMPLEPTQVTVDQVISSLDGKVFIFGGMKRGEDGVAVIQFVLKLPKGGKLLRTLRPTVEQMTGGMTMFVKVTTVSCRRFSPPPASRERPRWSSPSWPRPVKRVRFTSPAAASIWRRCAAASCQP